tara:strand:- start:277 stop:441 length:165 start_codon:yes stop_codon:yes gene_type:complete
MGPGRSLEKKVKQIIDDMVVIINKIFVRSPRFVDAKTLGISKKITKGFTTPPVK